MLYYGMNIAQTGDKLYPLEVAELHRRICHPKPVITDLIDRLRILQTVDTASYARLKKTLPYLVCAHFNPAIRRKEHFVSIRYFFLDLDHISGHFDPAALRQKLCADEEVHLLFASPGGDGLKLLFRLEAPCHDSGLYSAFYRLFVAAFAARHGLHQVIDAVTSDVSRACFISVDPEAWLRPDALPVKLDAYVQESEADAVLEAAGRAEKELKSRSTETAVKPEGPDSDVLNAIRQRLNPGARGIKREKHIEQPPQLDAALPEIGRQLEALGMQLTATEPIHFGKKLRISAGLLFAEINLFYGAARGYSVVQTTKTGSNKELCGLAAEAVRGVLDSLPAQG